MVVQRQQSPEVVKAMPANRERVELLTQELENLRQRITDLETQLAQRSQQPDFYTPDWCTSDQPNHLAAIAASVDGIAILNTMGEFVYANTAYASNYGYGGLDDLIGKNWALLYREDERHRLQQEIMPRLIHEGHWRGEIVGQRADGSSYPQEVSLTALKEGGLICIVHDISESKLAQGALQKALHDLTKAQTQLVQSEKMSSLGQLVAGVAHEINNPVNFIHGNINYANQYIQDLLELLDLYQTLVPEEIPKIQAKIEAIDLEFICVDLPKLMVSMKVGADRIREIVHSLRTFSRLDESEVKAVDVHEGIDSTLMILQSRLKETPIRGRDREYARPAIQVIKEYGNLPKIKCYAGQLNQVFMNILGNAIDALEESFESNILSCALENTTHPTTLNPKNAPTILIRTQLIKPDRIRISIADNGPGIAEDIRQRLFDPFFTTKPVGKGTGMGTSISYQIITERHGGELKCVSTPGEGAEFIIEIPVQK